MKKIILSLALLVSVFSMNAQSEMYKTGMKGMITRMDMADKNPEAYQEAANGFLRIAANEKTEWLPNYYAALCYIMKAMNAPDKSMIDPSLDQADELLGNIAKTVKNDEVMCLQALSKSTRISVDPMTRGMRYGGESAKLLVEANKLNPQNPRVYFLQAQSAYFTPEQFGGGKKIAIPLYITALEKFESYHPSNELLPTWGKGEATRMLALSQK